MQKPIFGQKDTFFYFLMFAVLLGLEIEISSQSNVWHLLPLLN